MWHPTRNHLDDAGPLDEFCDASLPAAGGLGFAAGSFWWNLSADRLPGGLAEPGLSVRIADRWARHGRVFVRLDGGRGEDSTLFEVLRLLDCPLGTFVVLRLSGDRATGDRGSGGAGVFAVCDSVTLRLVDPEALPAVLHWLRCDVELTVWHPSDAEPALGPIPGCQPPAGRQSAMRSHAMVG